MLILDLLLKEEPRVAHLAICTCLALLYSLCESLGLFAFYVIHFLRLLCYLFTFYTNNSFFAKKRFFFFFFLDFITLFLFVIKVIVGLIEVYT
jgi:hypothetical protein